MNVVCPHCLKITSIEQKETYTKEECTECQESLLDSEALTGNLVIVPNYINNSDIPVIVDFWAPTCGPCLRMKPKFEQLALDMPLQAQFLKVNTDSEQSMVSKYHIHGIPTLIAFKDGKEVDRVVGGINNKQLEKWIRSFV
ncbi:Thioredoxin [hydrothermal vent metagenome]|uniref:Thioredoxin n=1 Tax=hydrothermal vent metagenome TaxID=652676 RepID=A0A1W1CWJ8_9ZZZZ